MCEKNRSDRIVSRDQIQISKMKFLMLTENNYNYTSIISFGYQITNFRYKLFIALSGNYIRANTYVFQLITQFRFIFCRITRPTNSPKVSHLKVHVKLLYLNFYEFIIKVYLFPSTQERR